MAKKRRGPTSDLDRILDTSTKAVTFSAGVSIAGAAIGNVGSTLRRVK